MIRLCLKEEVFKFVSCIQCCLVGCYVFGVVDVFVQNGVDRVVVKRDFMFKCYQCWSGKVVELIQVGNEFDYQIVYSIQIFVVIKGYVEIEEMVDCKSIIFGKEDIGFICGQV